MRRSMLAAIAAVTTVASVLAAVGLAQTPGGALELISVSSDEVQGNQDSEEASISADGRFVAFASFSDNLVPEDTNGASDIFVRDRLTRTTERVSVGANGRQADGTSGILNGMGGPALSADARYVAFDSEAGNLVSGDRNGIADVFVHDRATGTTELVSVGLKGDPAGGVAPAISADGRFVSFTSNAFDLVTGESNFRSHIYVADRQTGALERVDLSSDETLGDSDAFDSTLSADGRFVAFDSFADNLVPNDGDSSVDVFVRDRLTGETEGISTIGTATGLFRHSLLASITPDGRWVGFSSTETNLVPDDTNNRSDAFLFDRQTDTVELVSRSSAGAQGDSDSYGPLARADGRVVVFTSDASNFAAGDANDVEDVYRRDLDTGVTERLAGDDEQFGFPTFASDVTADASVVAMVTRADLLPETDVGFFANDVYVLDLRPAADLAVTQTDSPDPVAVRSDLTYTVTVRNDGPGTADGVTLVDRLPEAVFVSATASQGTCVRAGKGSRDGQLTCDLGTLAAGSSATVTIVVRPGRGGATLTNAATVRANQPDGDRADNTSTETTSVLGK